MVAAVVVQACIDFKVGIRRFEVTREGLEVLELLLEV